MATLELLLIRDFWLSPDAFVADASSLCGDAVDTAQRP